MIALYRTMIVSVMAVAACSKSKEEPVADTHGGMAMDTSRMDGMPGMGGPGVMSMMPSHMDSMMRMNPDQMSGMMAQHERMMSKMMDQMGGEMRQMKMAETPDWRALTDSVKRDLADLPILKGQALSKRMRAHADRVRRLIAAHEQMMKK